jgi:hypothetical protein
MPKGWIANARVAAFEALARELGAYPSRKNLLWLAESFPIALGAQLNETNHSANYSGLAFAPGARAHRQRADCGLSH